MNHATRLYVMCIIVLCWFAAVDAGENHTLTVSAGMGLKDAFEEVAASYERKYYPVTVHLNLGASGDLTRQIIAGAPVDVFATPSQRDMDGLAEKNCIQQDSRTNFTGNEIVLIQPVKAVPTMASFADLAKVEIQRIALGNPKSVPAGTYGIECLKYLDLFKVLQPKLIFCEHVRQVLDYTARGEVDAGFVYATDAQSRPLEVRIVVRAPAGSLRPIVYPIAVIKDSPVPLLAQEFIDLVISEEGQGILLKYGFKRIRPGE